MENLEYIVYFIGIIFVLLNLYASFKLLNSNYYNNIQKTIQILIIWFLPIIGAILILSLLKSTKIEKNPYTGASISTDYLNKDSSSSTD